jgi:hypothetical protein
VLLYAQSRFHLHDVVSVVTTDTIFVKLREEGKRSTMHHWQYVARDGSLTKDELGLGDFDGRRAW